MKTEKKIENLLSMIESDNGILLEILENPRFLKVFEKVIKEDEEVAIEVLTEYPSDILIETLNLRGELPTEEDILRSIEHEPITRNKRGILLTLMQLPLFAANEDIIKYMNSIKY